MAPASGCWYTRVGGGSSLNRRQEKPSDRNTWSSWPQVTSDRFMIGPLPGCSLHRSGNCRHPRGTVAQVRQEGLHFLDLHIAEGQPHLPPVAEENGLHPGGA